VSRRGSARYALDGGRGVRTTRVTTTFDSYGMPAKIDDYGDASRSGDEQCTSYSYGPRNTDACLIKVMHRTRVFAVGCAAADPATLSDADVISDVRTWFDGHAYGVAPTRGLPTRTEEIATWNAGSPGYVTTGQASYDGHGRALETRDALNRPTTTGYTPTTGGPVTGTTVTNALGHVTTTTLDPAFGQAIRTVDPNGKTTDLAYDPLGRLTSVWLPGRARNLSANMAFTYQVRDTNVTSVTSRTLNPSGNYLTTHTLYDGVLREVQTQAPAASTDGGRLLTNTFYDNVGRARLAYDAYYHTAPPSTNLYVPIEPLNVPTQTRTVYDGASRIMAEIFQPYNVERWRTAYHYGGDRTDTIPPAGGTVTATVTDGRGRTVELRQYQGSASRRRRVAADPAADLVPNLARTPDGMGSDSDLYGLDYRNGKLAVVPIGGLSRDNRGWVMVDGLGRVTHRAEHIDHDNQEAANRWAEKHVRAKRVRSRSWRLKVGVFPDGSYGDWDGTLGRQRFRRARNWTLDRLRV
jgi:YD repeat-containing protein